MANFQPKTRIVNGQRVDITTNQPYTPRLSQGTTVIPPMKAADLGTVQPIALPPDTLSTTSTGFSGFMEQYLVGQQEQIKEQQKLAEKAQTEQSTQSDVMKETMRSLVGLPAQQAQMEQKAGIDEKTELVTKYTNQLEAEQQGLVRQVERIRKNDQGLFGGGMEQEINRVERESLTKQADLALLQSAANRDLSTAQGIIDRKIELMTEPLKLKLQFDQFFYNENKDQLTKAQDRQFQLMANSDKTALDFSASNQKQIHDAFIVAAQNGAPESVQKSILAASTSEEAMQAVGGYFVDPLDRQYKQAQIASANRANQGGGSGGGYTAQELRKLRAAGINSKDIEASDAYLYGDTGDTTFTTTQFNKGASIAGTTLEEFKTYDVDSQNYFVNHSQAQIDAAVKSEIITPLTNGDKTAEELKTAIDAEDGIAPKVKEYMKKKVDENAPASSWTGTWKKIKGFFGY